jgi:hypothetical protein
LANAGFENIVLSVFPNPSNGIFTINTLENNFKIVAFDVLGKEVALQTISENQFSINNKGIFFLKIISDNGKISNHKIVIE